MQPSLRRILGKDQDQDTKDTVHEVHLRADPISVLRIRTAVPVISKDCSFLQYLLERGADVNVRSEGGPAPLHTTSYNGVLEVARLIFEYGADVATEGNYGNIPLQLGANRGHQKVVKVVRKHGAPS